MFEYNVCNVFDTSIFNKQCLAIEKHIPNIKKSDLLTDVDGSLLKKYVFDDDKIVKVENDVLLGVTIKSDVPLEQYFK